MAIYRMESFIFARNQFLPFMTPELEFHYYYSSVLYYSYSLTGANCNASNADAEQSARRGPTLAAPSNNLMKNPFVSHSNNLDESSICEIPYKLVGSLLPPFSHKLTEVRAMNYIKVINDEQGSLKSVAALQESASDSLIAILKGHVVTAEKAIKGGSHEKLTMTVAVPYLWGVPHFHPLLKHFALLFGARYYRPCLSLSPEILERNILDPQSPKTSICMNQRVLTPIEVD
ncbi:unnamed protein product [Dovyalis caffra]|uniref:DUF7811 domain-containing protein n=1 Tax=Dovyalis caffra TaxID=77055 RepID=A0AAV1S9Y5_9ROSI|nr:unnamed protein product [Dovyalis caffra]